MAIADTGTSGHYFTASAPVADINPSAPRITIRTAVGSPHTSTATAQLALDTLPSPQARSGHIIPGFTDSLISIGKLCDWAAPPPSIDNHSLSPMPTASQYFLAHVPLTAHAFGRYWPTPSTPLPPGLPHPRLQPSSSLTPTMFRVLHRHCRLTMNLSTP